MCSLSGWVIAGYDWFLFLCLCLVHAILYMFSASGLPIFHWVGRAGLGRHGGGAPALCGGPMMSALILWHFDLRRIFDFLSRRKGKSTGDGGSSVPKWNISQILEGQMFFIPFPLRVHGKVVILRCRWPINRVGRKIDPTSIFAEITKSKAPIF